MSEDPANVSMRRYWGLEEVDLAMTCHWVRAYAEGRLWQRFEYWRDRVGIPKDARTIEVGCGWGRFSLLLGLTGARVALLDYNEDAVRSAEAIYGQLGMRPECFAESMLDLPDDLKGAFDVVCSIGVLEHFAGEYRETAFRSCVDLLRPGGMMYFTVPNRLGVLYRLAFELRNIAGAVPDDFCEIPYSKCELLRMAAKTGVEPLEVVSAGTIKEDYDYWIRPNLGSLARKVMRLERQDPPPPTEVNTPEELRTLIDNAPRASTSGCRTTKSHWESSTKM